jgi:putative transposase
MGRAEDADPVPMRIRILPTYPIAEVMGSSKGRSAIAVARQFGGRKRKVNSNRLFGKDIVEIKYWQKQRP